jgi:hypothetical protein
MTSTLLSTPELTMSDRCDRCGAQAFYRAVLSAGELLFCAHHGRAYAARLAEVAVAVQDGTAAINCRPSPAAY